jgi:uncharacterized lipoprotein
MGEIVMRSAKVGVFVIAASLAIALSGCGAVTESDVAAPPSTPTATQRPLPKITLSSSDLAACSIEPTKSRIDRAVAQSTISSINSPLALPQDMGSYAKAASQMKAWKALSEADRLFQVCFNYQQGSFAGNTPTP